MKGHLEIHKVESKVLKNNALKDPTARDLIVYIPESYRSSNSSGYPVVFLLPSWGNNNYSINNKDPFSPTIYERLEKLVEQKNCGEMVIAVPNCFNKLGGSQYLNSPAIGNYKDYFIEEIVPLIDLEYNISNRAILGKSSGGYGAITIGMEHPNLFKAISAHSFDSAFEYCYLPDFPIAFKTLKKAGGPKNWLTNFWNKENKHEKNDFITLNILSMAAHYSPNSHNQEMHIELPFNMDSGDLIDDIWCLWKKRDPLNMIDKYKENLKKVNLLYFDCGIHDEFNLFIGAKAFSEKCKKFGIDHEYLEYDGGHFNTSFRYDISLTKIFNSLS